MSTISKELKEKCKGKQGWVTYFEGHEIKIVNKARVTMYIDGVEAARQKGLLSTHTELEADIPDTEYTISAKIGKPEKGSELNFGVSIVVGRKMDVQHGFEHKDGSFVTLTDEEAAAYFRYKKEQDDAATTAAIMAALP